MLLVLLRSNFTGGGRGTIFDASFAVSSWTRFSVVERRLEFPNSKSSLMISSLWTPVFKCWSAVSNFPYEFGICISTFGLVALLRFLYCPVPFTKL